MDYEATDRWALLAIAKICPRHGTPLEPVVLCDNVWGCAPCGKTWHLPDVEA
jgi:hypothetical protein